MKRIEHRSAIALLLAAALLLGMGFFVVRLALYGGDWAAYSANQHIYQNGVLKNSTLTDRNGVILAQTENGSLRYADDPTVRVSSVHAVGDSRGYMDGALSLFADELAGYSFVNGTPGGGAAVALSLDTRLQTAAWTALAGRAGAVLVLNYETGEILAMVSSPSYDPNGEPDMSIDGLFLNRCTLAAFTPGSVFKLVTLIAAAENIPDLTERTFRCEQYLDLPGGTVVCTGYHGDLTIEQALADSCNCVFAELALELGSDTIVKTAQRLGVAGSLTLDGAATASGRVEPAETGSSDEAWLGIGQYTDLVTPFSMARLCAAIANGGEVYDLCLIDSIISPEGEIVSQSSPILASELNCPEEYLNAIREGMKGVVDPEGGGTATKYFSDFSYKDEIGAKTGTAEKTDIDLENNAWMVAFAPYDDPEIAMVVYIPNGYSGAHCSPTVRDVLEYYLDQRLIQTEDFMAPSNSLAY